ncbi:MAG: DUF1836 domain-containing protein [Clostridia bacterium]|nr:DUF1836 domain-containing protein [Clostridia bacterium]
MNYLLIDDTIPGTNLKKEEIGGLTGKAFLRQVFFVSDGVMLSQIRKIAGIDGSTLQNWTKRGWVANSHSKRYNMDQVAHIFLINMLRSCMQLNHIAWLIEYINGDVEDSSDDIISDSDLYDEICTLLDRLSKCEVCTGEIIRRLASEQLSAYQAPVDGARERLLNALEIIVVSYYASLVKKSADAMLRELTGEVADAASDDEE